MTHLFLGKMVLDFHPRVTGVPDIILTIVSAPFARISSGRSSISVSTRCSFEHSQSVKLSHLFQRNNWLHFGDFWMSFYLHGEFNQIGRFRMISNYAYSSSKNCAYACKIQTQPCSLTLSKVCRLALTKRFNHLNVSQCKHPICLSNHPCYLCTTLTGR